jgi:PAS domain S-box-containing protein
MKLDWLVSGKTEQLQIAVTRAVLALIILAALLQPLTLRADAVHDHGHSQLLLLHSYHHGLPWTDSLHEGFMAGLGDQAGHANLFIEYLDVLRFPLKSKAMEEALVEKLVARYRDRGIDMLIASDDPAYRLLLAHRERIAPGKPLLFAGVNNLRPEQLKGLDNLAGVAETPDFPANLALMQRLHSQAGKLLVLGDATATFESNLSELKAANAALSRPFSIEVIAHKRINELTRALKTQAGDQLVFLMGRPLDDRGNLVTGPETAAILRQVIDRPIYSGWSFFLGHGIVGGKLVSGIEQGRTVANMAVALIEGKSIADLPRLTESPNRFAFDYRELARLKIQESLLPEGAQIQFRPPSFTEKNPELLTAAIAVLVILLALLILQSVYGRRNRSLSQALARELTLLQALMNAVPFPLFFKDGEMRYQRMNDAFLKLLGKTQAELLGQTVEAAMPDPHASIFRDKDEDLLQQGGQQIYEAKLPAADGSVHDMVFHKATVRLADGTREGIVGAMLDVTELRRIEHDLRELNLELEARVCERTDELARSNSELQRAVDSLSLAQGELVRSERLSSLGAMVAGVAHELNTPIGNSLTVATTLQDAMTELAEEITQGTVRRSSLSGFLDQGSLVAEMLVRNLKRAATLISNFKEVAVDQTSDRRRTFNLREVVEEIVQAFELGIRGSRPQIMVDIPEDPVLESYPGALGQILLNLLENARIHAFADGNPGEIRIATVESGPGRIQIHFSDNGKGIAADDLPRIFDPFFTTRLGQGGSGLGLSIVYRLTTQILDGKIRASSQPGKGTMLVLDIPIVAPAEGNFSPEGPAASVAMAGADNIATSAESTAPVAIAATPLHLRDDLLDIRELVESRAAAVAALNATESDKSYLQRVFDRLDASFVGDDLEAQVECDLAFHIAIIEATHDPALIKVGDAIIQLMYGHIRSNLSGLNPNPVRRATLRAQHRQMFEAIMAGDTANAATVAAAHMAYVRAEGKRSAA